MRTTGSGRQRSLRIPPDHLVLSPRFPEGPILPSYRPKSPKGTLPNSTLICSLGQWAARAKPLLNLCSTTHGKYPYRASLKPTKGTAVPQSAKKTHTSRSLFQQLTIRGTGLRIVGKISVGSSGFQFFAIVGAIRRAFIGTI